MVATSRNAWFIPVGSFAVAMLLSLFAGPVGSVVARMPQQQTGSTDLCHKPTKKDGENDAGGKFDGKKITTQAQGTTAQNSYVNDVEFWYRKPTGEVRYFAGGKNGAKVPGLDKKHNFSMRGWTLIHGATGDCCHTATLETDIVLYTGVHIPKPESAGTSTVDVEVQATMDQFADNCAQNRDLKKKISRTIRLFALRFRDSFDNLIDTADISDSESPGIPRPRFESGGFINYQVNLKGPENWFFRKDTQMDFKGTTTISKVESGAGQNQLAEGTAWVFASPSRYSVADSGNVNQCSN